MGPNAKRKGKVITGTGYNTAVLLYYEGILAVYIKYRMIFTVCAEVYMTFKANYSGYECLRWEFWPEYMYRPRS